MPGTDWKKLSTEELHTRFNDPNIAALRNDVEEGQREAEFELRSNLTEEESLQVQQRRQEEKQLFLSSSYIGIHQFESVGRHLGDANFATRNTNYNMILGLSQKTRTGFISHNLYYLKKEESSKKLEEQELRAAERRHSQYPLDEKIATASIKKYRKQKVRKNTMNVKILGDEFETEPDSPACITEDTLTKLLLSRDAIKYFLSSKKGPFDNIPDAIKMEHYHNVYNALDDLLNTWYNACGMSSSTGWKVGSDVVDSAKKHLPLALENYYSILTNANKFMAENVKDLMIGTKDYEDALVKNHDEVFKASEANTGTHALLQGTRIYDILNVYDYVYYNPGIYQANKDMVDMLLRDYSRCIALQSEVALQKNAIHSTTSGDLKAVSQTDSSGYEDLMGLQAIHFRGDAITSVLDFIFKGEKCADFSIVTYALRAWNINICKYDLDQSPHNDISASAENFYQSNLTFLDTRIEALQHRSLEYRTAFASSRAELAQTTDEMKKHEIEQRIADLNEKIDRLSPQLSWAEQRRQILEQAHTDKNYRSIIVESSKESPYEVDLQRLNSKIFGSKYPAIGFREVARAFGPFDTVDPNLEDQLRMKIEDLSACTTGNSFFTDRIKIPISERIEKAQSIMASLEYANGKLQQFVALHQNLFKVGDYGDMIPRVPQLFGALKQAQGTRDICVLFEPDFEKFPVYIREQIVQYYIFSSALYNYIEDMFERLSDGNQFATYGEWFQHKDKFFRYADFNEALNQQMSVGANRFKKKTSEAKK